MLPTHPHLCASIAYGADDILCGNSSLTNRFGRNDVSVNDLYDLTTANTEQIQFFTIDSDKDLIPAKSIYNSYTGIGGLYNLKQSDFASYNDYAEAKKEFEMEQSFTPHEVCRDMVDVLCPVPLEMILDMSCGMGNFFNHLPNRHSYPL